MSEQSSFDKVVSSHSPALISYLKGLKVPSGEIDDVSQEAFIRLWQVKDRATIANLRGYLFKIAANVAKDAGKTAEYQVYSRQVALEEALQEPQFRVEAGDDGKADRRETKAVLWKAIRKLPQKQRDAIRMSFKKGLSYREIGVTVGRSKTAVERTLKAALQQLRRTMMSSGDSHESR